jgi:hypothetical protein
VIAADLNHPSRWLAWLRACSRDESSRARLRLPGPLGMLTGQEARALGAVACCWALYASGDDDGQGSALAAVRALLSALRPHCRGFARELIAQALDWNDRERLWPLVVGGQS